jgi:hypothetical protein
MGHGFSMPEPSSRSREESYALDAIARKLALPARESSPAMA